MHALQTASYPVLPQEGDRPNARPAGEALQTPSSAVPTEDGAWLLEGGLLLVDHYLFGHPRRAE